MKIVYYNGQYFDHNSKEVSLNSRGIRYGDGVFESVLGIQNKIPLLKRHYKRFQEALSSIGLKSNLREADIIQIIECLKLENKIDGNFSVNLIANRRGTGGYIPEEVEFDLLCNINALDDSVFTMNTIGKKMGLYKENAKSYGTISKFKTASSLIYVLAAKYCADNNFDDCFILNSAGTIAEAYSSNVFIVSNGSILTPPIEAACVSGTMRAEILEVCAQMQCSVSEIEVSLDEARKADEIFTSNAVKGIQWVKQFENSFYGKGLVEKISEAVKKKWDLI